MSGLRYKLRCSGPDDDWNKYMMRYIGAVVAIVLLVVWLTA